MNTPVDHTRRHLDFSTLLNARDLGYLPTRDGRLTRPGTLVRSEYLGFLDAAGRQALLDYGVRTIIDLRFAWELVKDANPFQLNPSNDAGYVGYVNISLLGEAGDPHYEPLQALEKKGGSPTAWVEPQLELGGAQIARIMKTIANAPAGGVLFHCYAGKDRTGVIAQLLLSLAGVPDEVIVEDHLLSNERLASRTQPLLDAIEDLDERERQRVVWSVDADTARKVLNFVKHHHGSAEAYLRHTGLTDAEIAQLRGRLLAE